MSTSKDIINYTDFHNVDEDLKVILTYGGRWASAEGAAVFRRYADSVPHSTTPHVASRRNITQHDS